MSKVSYVYRLERPSTEITWNRTQIVSSLLIVGVKHDRIGRPYEKEYTILWGRSFHDDKSESSTLLSQSLFTSLNGFPCVDDLSFRFLHFSPNKL